MSSPEELFDPINRPKHYNKNGMEAIDVIEAFAGGSYLRGNALKYLLRADYKGEKLKDLKKSLWYVQREIGSLEMEKTKEVEAHVKAISERAPYACPDHDDLWCNPPIEDHQKERIVPRFEEDGQTDYVTLTNLRCGSCHISISPMVKRKRMALENYYCPGCGYKNVV